MIHVSNHGKANPYNLQRIHSNTAYSKDYSSSSYITTDCMHGVCSSHSYYRCSSLPQVNPVNVRKITKQYSHANLGCI